MKNKLFTIFINEAEEFTDSATNYIKNLEKSILDKQEKIKNDQLDLTKKQEEDKKLEIETKNSQKYNLGQIAQKKAAYSVTKDPEEQKRIKLELDRLNIEKTRIDDTLKNSVLKKQEFLKNKQKEIKDTQDSIKKDQQMKIDLQKTLQAKEQSAKKTQTKVPAPQAQITTESNKIQNNQDYLDKYGFMIRRKFSRMEEQEQLSNKKKTLIVNFDKSTKTPFQVKFTERGFLIGETRLSFEFLEAALSKEVNIVLENGSGLVLDAIKMQKILKYKDRI